MSGGAKKLLHAAAGTSAAGGSGLFPEDVFSTYLYIGNAATGQSIVNGIDLSGEGGLVWGKSREDNANNGFYDTERGVRKVIYSNNNSGQSSDQSGKGLTAFNNNGFTLGDDWAASMNVNGSNMVAWTFRKAPGFFDIVTYTGNGTAGKTVAHNLGSVPKMIWVKRTDTSGDWRVYHWRLGNDAGILLNASGNAGSYAPLNNSTPTSSQFVLNDNANVNANNGTYVAYLFGEDDIFGEDGDQQICKIDRYNGTGTSGLKVDVGFEPQWILVKCNGNPWAIMDIMRGANGQAARSLQPNSNSAEQTVGQYGSYAVQVTSTGFTLMTDDEGGGNANNTVYLYMAIRRPMKVPTAGTEVFATRSGTLSGNHRNTSFTPIDTTLQGYDWHWWQEGPAGGPYAITRLANWSFLELSETSSGSSAGYEEENPTGYLNYTAAWDNSAGDDTDYFFKRAPKFMDVVAYVGTASTIQSITHNLTVIPEMIITKSRSSATNWGVYHVGSHSDAQDYITFLNTTDAPGYGYGWANFTPTDTIFKVGNSNVTNKSGDNIIAYLFATLAGISKVGSVVHSGTTNVDCGFSAGARLVLVKRTDSTGDWWVWDTARGIVSGNDPYLRLNSSAQQNTADYIDPLASGFTLTSSFTAGTYIFLAIA